MLLCILFPSEFPLNSWNEIISARLQLWHKKAHNIFHVLSVFFSCRIKDKGNVELASALFIVSNKVVVWRKKKVKIVLEVSS